MKYMNIIKLLTVLLCIGMLFVACDNAEAEGSEEVTTEATDVAGEDTGVESETQSATETETAAPTEVPTKEELLESVEAKFENFFEELEAESGELTSVERIEGTIVGFTDSIVIIKESDIDVKNIVTETYKVYNLLTGEVVLTLTDDYFNCEHDDFNFNTDDFRVFEKSVLVDNGDGTYSSDTVSDKTYRESYMKVSIYSQGVSCIIVSQAEVTPIDDATREENPEGCVYKVETKYSYYDAYGTLVAESNTALNVSNWSYSSSSDMVALLFGLEIAYFDVESGKFIRKVESIAEDTVEVYRYENDRYGYYSTSRGNYNQYTTYFMDIVDKISGKVLRYHFDNAYQSRNVFYLHNGDVVIQYRNSVNEEDPYDYYRYDGANFYYYAIKTVILNAENGNETVIEKPAFYISSLLTGEEFSEIKDIAKVNGVEITANTRNLALVQHITNGVISDVYDVVVLDNDLSVIYTFEKIIDQQKFETIGFGYSPLANGDKLVYIGSADAPYAIVDPDGTVRAYLASNMRVVGNYVADDSKLYDYDLNLICNFGEKGYTVIDLFGECVFYCEKDGRCMRFTVVDEKIILEDIFEYKVSFVNSDDDYAIFYNTETQKYTLYNESMTPMLASSGYISIYSIDDGVYLVRTYAGDEYTCYVLK